MLKLVVLLSGRGSNFQAIFESINTQNLPVSIELVLSDNPQAGGLHYAQKRGIETAAISPKDYDNQGEFNKAVLQRVQQTDANWAVLAGYMRLVNADFIAHFDGQVLNIHPSLLPKYKGLNTHQRALDAGDKTHGASVHLVTEKLDDGPIIIQSNIEISDEDSADTLAARLLQTEHSIYPQTIKWLSSGDLRYSNQQLYFNNKPLNSPISWQQLGQ